MAPESVSFRITRSTEDLAETIHALSHRLVRLEQRFSAMELALEAQAKEPQVSAEELSSLDQVERLLQDCRTLLASDMGFGADRDDVAVLHGDDRVLDDDQASEEHEVAA